MRASPAKYNLALLSYSHAGITSQLQVGAFLRNGFNLNASHRTRCWPSYAANRLRVF